MAESPLSYDPERDGCNCASWIERCAHYSGQKLRLAGPARLAELYTAARTVTFLYRVTMGDEDAPPCCTECAPVGGQQIHTTYYDGDDFASALAAFHEAEESLLRGVE